MANTFQKGGLKMKCPYCNTDNSDGQKFCGNCGKPIMDSRANLGDYPCVYFYTAVGDCFSLDEQPTEEYLRKSIFNNFHGILFSDVDC